MKKPDNIDVELLKRLFPGASKSTIARNEAANKAPSHWIHPLPTEIPGVTPGKRIRQKPDDRALNKLEAAWFEMIRRRHPNYPEVRAQSKRYRLGNGIWYKPDFSVSIWPDPNGPARETCWEVKGQKAWRGGFENLKVAAATFPEVRWILVWKEGGEWKQQEVKP